MADDEKKLGTRHFLGRSDNWLNKRIKYSFRVLRALRKVWTSVRRSMLRRLCERSMTHKALNRDMLRLSFL